MRKLKYKKLSQAIRAGMKLRPHKIVLDYVHGTRSACTLGCAAVATKIHPANVFSVGEKLKKMYSVLVKIVKHPITGDLHHVQYIINDLNDYRRWSRNRILRWVERIEKGAKNAKTKA